MDNYRPVDRDPAPERYGRLRVLTDDPNPARRLTERRPGHGDFGTVAGVAAPGFASYARVLHPASLSERPVRWTAVGAAYGRELIGMDRDYGNASGYGLPAVWGRTSGAGADSARCRADPDEVLLAGTLAEAVSPVLLDEFAELLAAPELEAYAVAPGDGVG